MAAAARFAVAAALFGRFARCRVHAAAPAADGGRAAVGAEYSFVMTTDKFIEFLPAGGTDVI